MIDTHAHLDFSQFDQDREEVIARFFESGGRAIINIGVDLEHSRKSIEIAEKHKNIFASVGLHPDFFMEHRTWNMEQIFGELEKLARNKKVAAMGETGLDYYSHTDNPIIDAEKENQKAGFIEQIKLAQELNLPVIVHCRDAWEDLYKIIFKVRPFPSRKQVAGIPQGQTFFVLHCYSGEKRDTEKFLKLPNVYFSFSGNITYPKPKERAEKLSEAIKMIPLDKIMLDSDAPFLAPQEVRGKRNEPINVLYIAKKIAEIKGLGTEIVLRATDENAVKFFGLKL